MVVISVYTYGVKIIKKFQWESGFLWGGSMEPPPLCTNGSAGYLMQLSVKIHHKKIIMLYVNVINAYYRFPLNFCVVKGEIFLSLTKISRKVFFI